LKKKRMAVGCTPILSGMAFREKKKPKIFVLSKGLAEKRLVPGEKEGKKKKKKRGLHSRRSPRQKERNNWEGEEKEKGRRKKGTIRSRF